MWKISTKNIIFSLFLCAGFATFSCKKKPPIPADVFLTKGIKYAKEKKYDSCVNQLVKIDELHPYSAESKAGMPVLIYCHYMNRDYDTIYPMIESFESLYPNSDQLPYLYYIKALSYFRVIKNYRRSIDVIVNLENTIFALYERDSQGKYAENLLHLLPFIAEMKLQNKIYTAQYYVSQQDYISATGRYTEILSQDLEKKQREELEKSFSAVMKNMGIKLEN